MKTLYVDMDNVIVDFRTGIEKISEEEKVKYEGRYDEVPRIFSLMDPMEGAIEAFNKLSSKYDTYILSTSPWNNPSAWQDKIIWVQKFLEKPAYKRLILSHHKNLNRGDYIIDDRVKNGVDKFEGEHIHFGSEKFPNWDTILKYLL
jgi:5'-nucleotidase